MKVKFADKIYDVLYTMKFLGKRIYAVEDEPNHIDWLVNVEVVDEEPKNEEPKDEEIRKWIIDDIRYNMNNEPLNDSEYKKKAEKAIAWLEKQGEQKLFDYEHASIQQKDFAPKVEPKFREGDWVILEVGELSSVLKITKIDKHKKMYWFYDESYLPIVDDDCLRFWTIQDAKDGDVLVCESGWTCIFKTLVNEETFSSYCFMDSTEWFCGQGSECHTLKEEFVKAYNGKIQPATKEQRDLFFKKMQEAGYEWNKEKKELKNLKEESENCKQEIMSEMADLVKDYIRQKSTWTEEDKKKLELLIKILEVNHPHGLFKVNSSETMRTEELVSWLKSLNS